MSAFSKQLSSLLQEDLTNISQLEAILQQEREAITRRDTKNINRITQQKKELIQQLDGRAKSKATLLAKSGLGIRPGHVEESLRKLGDAELMTLWQESRSALENCKEKNMTNGLLISRSLQRTNKLMTIIRGQAKAPSLYGQRGKETSYSGSQHLGKA